MLGMPFTVHLPPDRALILCELYRRAISPLSPELIFVRSETSIVAVHLPILVAERDVCLS